MDNGNSNFIILTTIRLYLFRLIKGLKNYEKLNRYLEENQEEAFQIGIYKDENNKIKIPPKRSYNHNLKTKITSEQKEQLNLIAEEILSVATENKIILDIEIVKKTLREKKKTYDKEKREAIKLVKKLVYPNIKIKMHHNARFTTKDLLDVLVHVGLTHDFTNNGSNTLKEDNPDIDSPSGDLMMHHFSKFKSVEQVQNIFDAVLDIIFKFAKKEYNLLHRRKLDIAYDVHKVPYYGKQMPYVCGGKHENGTDKFFNFLTCSIVVAGKRFILDIIPMHPLNNLHKLIDESLFKIKKKIGINFVYLDRGFDNINIINVLKKNNLNFIMPKVRTPTVKAWFDKSEACKSRVIPNFQMGRGKKKAFANLILVDDKLGIKRAFVSNFNISPQLAYRFYEMYSKRWGIEISYRNIEHDFKPRTTTKNYLIRMFYFCFSACLFNLWVLVNICLGLWIYGRVPKKPIITTKMFSIILYKIKEEYFNSGG